MSAVGQMTESESSFYNFLTCFFDRTGTWTLVGRSLAEFICNREISSDPVQVGMIDVEIDKIVDRLDKFQVDHTEDENTIRIGTYGRTVEVKILKKNIDLFFCPEPIREAMRIKNKNLTADGRFSITVDEKFPYALCIPYNAGTVLDQTLPRWYLSIEHRPAKYTEDIFFDTERRAAGYDLINKMLLCGERAGIRGVMSIGFGVALGYAREGDFISWDRDIDMCIDQDSTTAEQHAKYFEECDKAGLMEHRKVLPSVRDDNRKYLWFSLGEKNPFVDHGVKSCQWFQFEHNGFLWHSKGGLWVSESKFKQKDVNWQAGDVAVCKGIPVEFAKEMVEIDFHGVQVRVPKNLGSYCDFYYPGWCVPRANKSSAHRSMLVIGDWNNQRTWRMC
jgi:hypothetical protein